MPGYPRKPTNRCQGSNEVIILVWWGVSNDNVTSLHFCEKGVKTAVRNYQQDILTNVVELLNQTMFQNRPWIFQQESAPVHKAKTMQQWLKNHVPKYISSDHWPSASPDLSPLDYKFWSVLEDLICTRYHHNLESLKQVLVKAVDNFPMDFTTFLTSINSLPELSFTHLINPCQRPCCKA